MRYLLQSLGRDRGYGLRAESPSNDISHLPTRHIGFQNFAHSASENWLPQTHLHVETFTTQHGSCARINGKYTQPQREFRDPVAIQVLEFRSQKQSGVARFSGRRARTTRVFKIVIDQG